MTQTTTHSDTTAVMPAWERGNLNAPLCPCCLENEGEQNRLVYDVSAREYVCERDGCESHYGTFELIMQLSDMLAQNWTRKDCNDECDRLTEENRKLNEFVQGIFDRAEPLVSAAHSKKRAA